ncbi:hypothetical protein GQ457_09G002520 [Hibiscus cannabinus]
MVQGSALSVVKPMAAENSAVNLVKKLATTAVLMAAVAPFERMKLSMQNQNPIIHFNSIHYAAIHLDAWSLERLLVFANATVVATPSLVYPFTYAVTCLATDVKTIGNMNNRQISCIFDIFRKTLKSDGITGPYHGFNIFTAELGIFMAISMDSSPLHQTETFATLSPEPAGFNWRSSLYSFRKITNA